MKIFCQIIFLNYHFISEKKKSLEFFILKRKIYRNDVLDIQKKILSMTPNERRRLGINKSTLWYMKKNFENSKTRKIYSKVAEKLV